MKRNLKDYISLGLKGMGMGAADVVPGVSGGTIAFIVGIYEELIESIKSINLSSLKLLFTLKISEFWKTINGNFLVSVVFGILISIFSLAKLITYFLEKEPIIIWSFFFGLILSSTWFVWKNIKMKSFSRILTFIIGALLAFFITKATPIETSNSSWYIFLCGAIAICAMILPGISGSFILVLLGKYFYIMEAVKNLDFKIIFIFGIGAILGIISFSNVLSWLLRKYHDITIALLSGFMFGSLNKVWPWKETIEFYTDRHGVLKPLVEKNILPTNDLVLPIISVIIGFSLVFIIEIISNKKIGRAHV